MTVGLFSLKRHESDQWFDAVSVRVQERYKESELSGDEWRFLYVITLSRKGVVLARRGTSRLDWTLNQLASMTGDLAPVGNDQELEQSWRDKSQKLFGVPDPNFEQFCAQPGCPDLATVEYRLKKSYCNRCGHGDAPHREERRRFCDAHMRRGDCGLDDADDNYELVRIRDVTYEPLELGPWTTPCL